MLSMIKNYEQSHHLEMINQVKKLNRSQFSANQLTLLEMLVNSEDGAQVIADKLCKSRITINHHLDVLRKVLGVTTTRGLISKAIKLGLVDTETVETTCLKYFSAENSGQSVFELIAAS